jgi:hypothetical protein
MLQARKVQVHFPMTSLNNSSCLLLPAAYGRGVYSVSDRNEYQESVCKVRPARKVDNLTAMCELPIAVAERSRARTVFARANTAIVGSNPT